MRYRRPITRLISGLLMLCFVAEGISAATKKPPLKPININTANSEELQQVPGIGPATAEKIRQYLVVSKSTAVNRTSRPPVSASPQKKPDPTSPAPQSTEAEEPPN